MFAGITKIPSSDEAVDASYEGHTINGVVYYYTREPNYIVDITETWDIKIEAVRCYQAQFETDDMDRLIVALEMKSSQIAQSLEYNYCEPLKVLHPSALHCGF
jgi:LmbE family N-acetylglucosaminyl deacetylase